MTAPTLALQAQPDASARAGAPGHGATRHGAPVRTHDGPDFGAALEVATSVARHDDEAPAVPDHVSTHHPVGDDDPTDPRPDDITSRETHDTDARTDPTPTPVLVPVPAPVPATAVVAAPGAAPPASEVRAPDSAPGTAVATAGAPLAGTSTSSPSPSSTSDPVTSAATHLATSGQPVRTGRPTAPEVPARPGVEPAPAVAVTAVRVPEQRRTASTPLDAAPAAETRPAWASAPSAPTTPTAATSATSDGAPSDGSSADSGQPDAATAAARAVTGRTARPGTPEGFPTVADGTGTDAEVTAPTDATPAAAPVGATLTARTDAPAAAAAGPPALPAALAETVAAHLRGIHRGVDGAHHAVLLIDADGLGQVRIELRTQGTTVDLVLRGGHAAATDALRDALPDLRRALTESGLVAGSTDVTDAGPDLASAWDGGATAGGTARDRGTATRRSSDGHGGITPAAAPPLRERTRTTAVDLIA